jgi:nitroimidazol reductase NimA-like FMN-containing flavoprotein (pyridoxamine 5'-phosphate oxidase superfamily)
MSPPATPVFDDRTKLEVLRRHACLELLRRGGVGRVAFRQGGRIVVVPVNFSLTDDHVVFRTDPGAKLDAAIAHQDVAFEIDAFDEATRTGWNVLVQGTASVVTDPDHLARLEQARLHPWARTQKAHWVEVALEDVWGRRVLSVYAQDALTQEGY